MNASYPLPWPEGTGAAVSLSFDDGSRPQLDIALPILDEFGLKGTFYVNPRGDDWQATLAPWRRAGLNGHEIGNHSISHLCSRGYTALDLDWQRVKGLEAIGLEQIEADVLEAERRLRQLLPEQEERSYGYPCYLEHVGQGQTRRSYVPVIASHFVAGRGKGELANHPALTDLHYLSSWPVAGWMTGANLIDLVENTTRGGRWTILTFHSFQEGPGSPWVPGSVYHDPPCPAAEFRRLCAHLAESRHLWTDTIVRVARRLTDWRAEIGLATT